MDKKRNGEIDFLRFVFAIIILVHHFNCSYDFGLFSNGYIGCEFFFVISGFLMAKQVQKKQSTNNLTANEIANSTWKYIIKKVGSFFPYYFGAIILQVIFRDILINNTGIVEIVKGFLRSIPTVSLTFLGLNYSSASFYVGNTWFLSAMIIAMFILYPLLLRSYNYSVKIILPLIALFIIGYLYQTNTTIVNWYEWSGFCYNGVLRAIAEISLGASLYPLSLYIMDKYSWAINSNNFFIKTSFTVIKFVCYIIVIAFAYGFSFGGQFTLYALLFCSIAILMSFSNVGYCISDCKLTRYLGKITLPIFIYHGFIRWSCNDFIPTNSVTIHMFLLMIITSIIISIILMYITDFTMKYLRQLVNKIKQHC